MAKVITILLISIISYLFVSISDAYAINAEEKAFVGSICGGKEKVTKLNFYVQDLREGNPSPTVYEVAAASITANSPTSFGLIRVIDDLLTAEPEYDSAVLGRVQGIIISAGLSTTAAAMYLNFYFTAARFNGSTITVLGRNPVREAQRELPIVGGTGAFRFARGYALTSDAYNDAAANYSVLRYTLYTTYNPSFSRNYDDVVEVAQI